MSRRIVKWLWENIVKHNRCVLGSPVPDEIVCQVELLKTSSREACNVALVSMNELEMLIDCLDALQEYYSELETNFTIIIHNILLQNRALLIQLATKEEMEYYGILLNQIFTSCIWFVQKKQPHIALPKNMFQTPNYAELPRDEYKVFDNDEERDLTYPKLKLIFLLMSQRLPENQIPSFLKRFFSQCNFVFAIFMKDVVGDVFAHLAHDCATLKNVMPCFVKIFRIWYAFSCHFEMVLWETAVDEGWEDKYVTRWMNYFNLVKKISSLSNDSNEGITIFQLNKINVRCMLSMLNLLHLPHWELYRNWLIPNGIESFYPLHVMGFILVEDNLLELKHEELYSQAAKNFNFINSELLPLVCLQNHMLDISDNYDFETAGQRPNMTRAIFKYAFGGEAKKRTGTPETLGLPQKLIDMIPNLRPHVEKVLQEPLLTKLNKELLGIYRKLGIDLVISNQAPHFVNLRAADPTWNLLGVNVVSNGPQKYHTAEMGTDLRIEEADVILDQLFKLV